MDFLSAITDIAGKDNVLVNEPMDRHTTFRAGGKAAYAVMPHNALEIAQLIQAAQNNQKPYYVVGNGSNLLVSDEGFNGMIILTGPNMADVVIKDNIVRAGAGALLSVIGSAALERELTGFEFASGIPGSVGGACVMNAGAYGGEIKDILVSVHTVDEQGQEREFDVSQMELGYRHSIFINSGYIITDAVFRLSKGSRADISSTMKELAAKRRDKQPLEYPSAGSTFKRPEGYFAGQLIEESGLKGKGCGAACVSDKHAGFVINKGNATAKDIYDTICFIRDTVKEKKGILLEPEVRMIGRF